AGRAPPGDLRPRPEQGEDAGTAGQEEVPRQPAAGGAVGRPLERLVDVAVGQVDGVLVPSLRRRGLDPDRALERPRVRIAMLFRGRHPASLAPSNAAALPLPVSPCVRLAPPTRALWAAP